MQLGGILGSFELSAAWLCESSSAGFVADVGCFCLLATFEREERGDHMTLVGRCWGALGSLTKKTPFIVNSNNVLDNRVSHSVSWPMRLRVSANGYTLTYPLPYSSVIQHPWGKHWIAQLRGRLQSLPQYHHPCLPSQLWLRLQIREQCGWTSLFVQRRSRQLNRLKSSATLLCAAAVANVATYSIIAMCLGGCQGNRAGSV